MHVQRVTERSAQTRSLSRPTVDWSVTPCETHGGVADTRNLPSPTGYEPKLTQSGDFEPQEIELDKNLGTDPQPLRIESDRNPGKDLQLRRIELDRNIGTDPYQVPERILRSYHRRYGGDLKC